MLTFHFRHCLPTLTSWQGKAIPPLSPLSALEPWPCLPASLPSEIIKVLEKSLVDPHPCKWSLSLDWYVIWVLGVACASQPPRECEVIWVGMYAAGWDLKRQGRLCGKTSALDGGPLRPRPTLQVAPSLRAALEVAWKLDPYSLRPRQLSIYAAFNYNLTNCLSRSLHTMTWLNQSHI